jgi:hypothetical protein
MQTRGGSIKYDNDYSERRHYTDGSESSTDGESSSDEENDSDEEYLPENYKSSNPELQTFIQNELRAAAAAAAAATARSVSTRGNQCGFANIGTVVLPLENVLRPKKRKRQPRMPDDVQVVAKFVCRDLEQEHKNRVEANESHYLEALTDGMRPFNPCVGDEDDDDDYL